MLNFNSILLFSENPNELADFYKKVLDKDPAMVQEGYSSFEAGSCWLTVGPHDAVKGKSANPERIMINFESTDIPGDFERIKGLGATVVKAPDPEDEYGAIATFADPDGNFFQLMPPFDQM